MNLCALVVLLIVNTITQVIKFWQIGASFFKMTLQQSAQLNYLYQPLRKEKNNYLPKMLKPHEKLASVRIHIERVIGVMKNRYTILKGTLNIVLVKSLNDEVEESCFTSIDKIVRVCASLTNLGDGIVYSEKLKYFTLN
ncbi:Hypothetical predicted protein [Mytilus galloprovincialis]|uniref:DDE Tnp4 domain-containing protein n=1 Tax=Mytilus galloprovincialis TaxID=29158 RepID=A0A8B6D3A8_MYTGA|nr:Hypothetical predicted protein [Mytilus galloprovincialis]